MRPDGFWYLADSFVIEIQGLQLSVFREWVHATFAFDFLTDFVINSSRTFVSTSSSLLIYKQPLPVLYFPSLFNTSRSKPPIVYRVRFCTRGEKPVMNQSPSRPEA